MGAQDLMHTAAWIDATTGGLQASWSRKLDTGDAANDAVIYPGVLTEVAFVIGNEPFFSLHGNSEEGGAAHTQLNFFESTTIIPATAIPAGTLPTGVPVAPPAAPTAMPTAQAAIPTYMLVGIVMGAAVLALAIGGYVWSWIKRQRDTNFAGGKLLPDTAPLSDVRFVPQQMEEGGAFEPINVYSQPYASAPEQVYQPPRPQSSSISRGQQQQQQFYDPRGASDEARSSQRSHSPRGRSIAAPDAYSINGSAGQVAAPRSPVRMHSPARSSSRKF